MGHFKSKCPQLYQCSGGYSVSRGMKTSRSEHDRGSRSASGLGQGRRERGGGRETNLVTRPSLGGEDNEYFTTPVHQQSPAYAFSVEQSNGRKEQTSALVTLVIGGVDVPDILNDSGATCNVMGQQTWELSKPKGIKCESRKSARELFAYGGTESLPTLGTFTADVMLAGIENAGKANFVVIKGNG